MKTLLVLTAALGLSSCHVILQPAAYRTYTVPVYTEPVCVRPVVVRPVRVHHVHHCSPPRPVHCHHHHK